ncbi:phage late control D family protein [Sapientia aquatica]|nr:contractile injection system protein, VgrG/Pvc8 family [Sapientia aquatica]
MSNNTKPKAPDFLLLYNGKNMTKDISSNLIQITWTHQLSGESDELEVELEDVDGRWLNTPFYPQKGAALKLSFGYAGEALIPVPSATIDEISLSGPPSTVSIRARSASSQTPVRTRSNQGFENTTLKKIAEQLAQKHGFKLIGEIDPLPLDRVTQYGQTDLAFLQKIATQHGYAVRVQAVEKELIFIKRSALHTKDALRSYALSDLTTWNVTDQVGDVPASGSTSYHDPNSKKLVTYGVKDGQTTVLGDKSAGKTSSADHAQKKQRATTKEVAASLAQSHLELKQLERTVANITLPGDPLLRAGMAIGLHGLGLLSGKYTCTKAAHTISRSNGYTMALELKRVVPGEAAGKAGAKNTLKVYGKSGGEVKVVDQIAKVKK